MSAPDAAPLEALEVLGQAPRCSPGSATATQNQECGRPRARPRCRRAGRARRQERTRIAPVLFCGRVKRRLYMPCVDAHRESSAVSWRRWLAVGSTLSWRRNHAHGPVSKTASTASGACFRSAPAAVGCAKHVARARSVCCRAQRDRCRFQCPVQSEPRLFSSDSVVETTRSSKTLRPREATAPPHKLEAALRRHRRCRLAPCDDTMCD